MFSNTTYSPDHHTHIYLLNILLQSLNLSFKPFFKAFTYLDNLSTMLQSGYEDLLIQLKEHH